MSAKVRTRHPFQIYEAIRSEPDAFARVVAASRPRIEPWVERFARSDRLFLVGAGTSHHAAEVGDHLIREYGGEVDSRVVHSFDFVHYGPRLTPRDAVVTITHRARGGVTVDALRRAESAGCFTALIAGEGAIPPAGTAADVVLPTVPTEKPYPHTVSYVGSIAVLAALASRIGAERGAATLLAATLEVEVPAAMRRALDAEPQMAELARRYAGSRQYWCVGGGPGVATAREIALKIKEMAYRRSEGLGVEELLHGPLLAAESDDLFILISPAGAAQGRLIELGAMLGELGAPMIVVGDDTIAPLRDRAAGWFFVPAVPEALATLTCLIPLQLFAYHLALHLGADPDRSRLVDPRFARAYRRTVV